MFLWVQMPSRVVPVHGPPSSKKFLTKLLQPTEKLVNDIKGRTSVCAHQFAGEAKTAIELLHSNTLQSGAENVGDNLTLLVKQKSLALSAVVSLAICGVLLLVLIKHEPIIILYRLTIFQAEKR